MDCHHLLQRFPPSNWIPAVAGVARPDGVHLQGVENGLGVAINISHAKEQAQVKATGLDALLLRIQPHRNVNPATVEERGDGLR